MKGCTCVTRSGLSWLDLKFLELNGLERMPGLTDKTLKDAIRHIKLRGLRLMSQESSSVKL